MYHQYVYTDTGQSNTYSTLLSKWYRPHSLNLVDDGVNISGKRWIGPESDHFWFVNMCELVWFAQMLHLSVNHKSRAIAWYKVVVQPLWEWFQMSKQQIWTYETIWVCLKIMYPYTQWLMIIIPTKWLFHWGYTPFSDIPIWEQFLLTLKTWDLSNLWSSLDIAPPWKMQRATQVAAEPRKINSLMGVKVETINQWRHISYCWLVMSHQTIHKNGFCVPTKHVNYHPLRNPILEMGGSDGEGWAPWGHPKALRIHGI